jgi:uncharacterized protein YpmB
MTNTIAGIAIATALMPPLCTAGYGLATWNLKFFGGAMFLFTINAIFIALATFVIVKSLGFPMVRYIDSLKRKRIARMASLVAVVIFGFSIYLFYGLFQKNQFIQKAENFIAVIKEKTGAGIINSEVNYEKRNLKIVILGKNIEENELGVWTAKMPDYGLKNVSLEIQQDDKTSKLLAEINTIKSSYVKNQELIANKEETIAEKDIRIRSLLEDLEKFQKKQIPFYQISQEAKINYEGIQSISFSNRIQTNFTSIDTLPVFQIQWYDTIENTSLQKMQVKKWLLARLQLDSIQVMHQ